MKMFDSFYDQYETDEHEVLALMGGSLTCAEKEGCSVMTGLVLGMKFSDTGVVHSGEEMLEWPIMPEEFDTEEGWYRFEENQICRLRVSRLREAFCRCPEDRTWCVVEVLDDDAECPELEALLEQSATPASICDSVVGELTFDPDANAFKGEMSWCNVPVTIHVALDEGADRTCALGRKHARELIFACEENDRSMRACAAEALLGRAKAFAKTDKTRKAFKVTKRELFDRLQMTDLWITLDESFIAYFDAKGLLGSDKVIVTGPCCGHHELRATVGV